MHHFITFHTASIGLARSITVLSIFDLFTFAFALPRMILTSDIGYLLWLISHYFVNVLVSGDVRDRAEVVSYQNITI